MSKETPLTVNLRNGELVIKIGINVIANAIARGNDFHAYAEKSGEYLRNFAIVDAAEFAKDVSIALTYEEEDGSSPISKLLDEMGQSAIDDGSTGVEHNQAIKFDEKSPAEKW